MKLYSYNGKSRQKDLKCVKNRFIQLSCSTHHHVANIPVLCNLSEIKDCRYCQKKRRSKIYAKAMTRWNQIKKDHNYIVLWTFGTSLDDNKKNRRTIKKYWDKLRKRMNHHDWQPLMRVVEAGSKGKKLHYHVIVSGKVPHSLLLDHWRDITGEKSNVNFKTSKGRKSERAFGYVVKYLSKGNKYYWMGDLLKAKDDWEPEQNSCSWSYVGVLIDDYKILSDGRGEKTGLTVEPIGLVSKAPEHLVIGGGQ